MPNDKTKRKEKRKKRERKKKTKTKTKTNIKIQSQVLIYPGSGVTLKEIQEQNPKFKNGGWILTGRSINSFRG